MVLYIYVYDTPDMRHLIIATGDMNFLSVFLSFLFYFLLLFLWLGRNGLGRSMSWMGPVMEALSKRYQMYEMGGSSRSDEEQHQD